MMSNSSATYYWENKESFQKKDDKRYQNIYKAEKSDNIVLKDTKTFLSMESKGSLSTEKIALPGYATFLLILKKIVWCIDHIFVNKTTFKVVGLVLVDGLV